MKHCLAYTLLSLSLLGPLSADVFFLGRNYDAATRTFSPNPDVATALEAAFGKVPAYPAPRSEENGLQLLYGRLLGVIKGDVMESGLAGYTFSDDSLRVEVITREGDVVGKPIQISVRLLQPVPHAAAIDTLWDIERFYGNIAGSFETEIGSEIFQMALTGILDPTGEMGLNELQVAVDLPEEFSHGWLTNFAYSGKPETFRQSDVYNLDTVNAFDHLFLGVGYTPGMHAVMRYNDGASALIRQLARDRKYHIYQDGVRAHVLEIIGLLIDFAQIDPARVQDPNLRERAKRLAYLGAQSKGMLTETMLSATFELDEEGKHYGRPVTLVDLAHAVFDVMEANRARFNLHQWRTMEHLLNAGVPEPERANRPHPDCAERAYRLYFDLLKTGALGEDEAENQRQLDAAKSRRGFAAQALIPGILNDDLAFTEQTRAAFRRIGYGNTDEVQAIVDALDVAIPQKYMGEAIFDKNFSLSLPSFEMSEIVAPTGLGGLPVPVAYEEGERGFSVNLINDRLEEEAMLQHALTVLKEIAFNLPQDAIGRERKVRIVENWRQIQLEELEEALKRQFPSLDDEPAKLTPERAHFQSELLDNWKAPQASARVEL